METVNSIVALGVQAATLVWQIVLVSGVMWQAAAAIAFAGVMFEAANPVPEHVAKRRSFENLAAIVSVISPFLLFLHAFWAVVTWSGGPNAAASTPMLAVVMMLARSGALVGLLILMILLTLAPAIPGWIIRKLLPSFGALLARIAPFLLVAAFVIAILATYQSVFATLDAALNRLS